ncbi:MAG: hypothetical protein ACREUM_10335 [Nitrosospira sp.]
MKFSSILTAQSLAFASALIFMGAGSTHAQLVGGQPAQGQGGSIVGQPPAGQSGTKPVQPNQPNYPSTGPTGSSDPVRDKLNRTNREAADIDRDGRISPEEASRMPPGAPPLPR